MESFDGWSHHKQEEFEIARIELGLPKQPSEAEKELIEKELIAKIKLEFPEEYELIEPKPIINSYSMGDLFKDLVGKK